jgi:hypothetical protein
MGRTAGAASANRGAAAFTKERAEALAEMNPATHRQLVKLEKMIGTTRENNLRFYHKLGDMLLEIERAQVKYTTQGYNLIEAALSIQKRTLRKAKSFARAYEKDQLKELIELKNEDTGFQLHWGHVDYLLTLKTERQRQQWAKQAVKQMWSPDILHDHIKKHYGERGNGGGRPHKLPGTVHAQIRQIKEFVRNFNYKSQNLWNGEENNVFANIQDEPPDELNEVDLDNLDELIDLLPQMALISKELRPLAVQAKKRVEAVLKAREKATKEVDKAESEQGKPLRSITLAKTTGRKRQKVRAAS